MLAMIEIQETIIRNRLRKLRIQHGVTQKQLGDMTGISGSAISDVESGRTWTIGLHVLLAYVYGLGISPEEMLDASDDMGTLVKEEDEKRLLAMFRSLPLTMRKNLLDLLAYMQDKG